MRNIKLKIDDGLIVPSSQLNALRRDVLEKLTDLRSVVKPHAFGDDPLPEASPHVVQDQPWLRARLARAGQLTEALADAVREIVLPAEEFQSIDRDVLARNAGKLMVEIPDMLFNNESKLGMILRIVKQYGVAGATAGNLGSIRIARESRLNVHGDYGLNVTNNIAAGEYARLGLTDLTVSFEMNFGRICSMGGDIPRGILGYGYLPLMAARNCPVADCANCKRDFPRITDRMGKQFFIDCIWGVPRLYNCVPLFLADRLSDLRNVDFLTLYFTRESPEQCAEIAVLYKNGGQYAGDKTRGLYSRKVI